MSQTVKLRVPFAIDDEQRLYNPETAEKGKHYFCPACKEKVILKRGEIKTAHFAHKTSESCNQETITHQTAKQLIQQVVDEWKSGKRDAPMLQRKCVSTIRDKYTFCSTQVRQPLPEKVERAVLEYSLDGFRVDVALMDANKPVTAIEIRYTHAVDEKKASQLSVPFIELNGTQVIKDPTVWEPIKDGFRPAICDACKQAKEQFQIKVREIAKQTRIQLPKTYYQCGLHECYKCEREILVFDWPKDGEWSQSEPEGKPRPRTIQYHYSQTIDHEYWVNTCPYCKAIQGDWYLSFEPDGAFFGNTDL